MKSFGVFAAGAAAALAVSAGVVPAGAATVEGRLAGQDRIDTAIAVKKSFT